MQGNSDIQGGAIYYDLQRPSLTDVEFLNNSADYGPDIASYPVTLQLLGGQNYSIVLEDVASGQTYIPGIQLELVDYDGQTVELGLTSTVTIQSIESDTRVDGTNKVVMTNGTVDLDDLILIAEPGSSDVNFEVLSNSIDYDRVSVHLGYAASSINLTASFRECESGEIELNNQCQACSPRTYSLGVNQTE